MGLKKDKVQQGYDLIGDIHGCGRSLEKLLRKMDYQHVHGCFRHATRKVIFVGDIVDRGPRIREALHIVKDMVDQGQAEIVLGNHEYNAMCYCTEGREGSGKPFLREHTARNHRLIRDTLEQFSSYRTEWHAFLNWFHSIPLFLEKPGFRVVHACWDDHAIARFKEISPDHCINMDFLHASCEEGSFESRLVDKLTRGTVLDLPDGESILSKDGLVRHMFRTKFWSDEPQTYNDVVFQPDPLPDEMAERELSAIEKQQLLTYPPTEPPVFVGHYWMSGSPEPIQSNIACLDYSAVKYGKLVAYRMDGEQVLDKSKFIWVEVEKE
ncbi:MAG: metallophosphoesterase [Oleiphilus sp.]